MTNGNDPAFVERNEFEAHQTTLDGKPCNCSWGLTKREWLAGMALNGLLAGTMASPYLRFDPSYAKEAVKEADALLEELGKENK